MGFLSPDVNKPAVPPPVIKPNSEAVVGTQPRFGSFVAGSGQGAQPLSRKASTSKSSLIGGA